MKDLHQLNTGARIDFKILHVTFNNVYNLAPYYLSSLLVKYQPVRSLHSSIGFFQQVPPVNTVSYAYPLSLVFILCTELRSVTVYVVLSNRWFSRYVIAAMLVDENKTSLISSFCSSTSNCTLQHCHLCL